jgi:hypothetical protein
MGTHPMSIFSKLLLLAAVPWGVGTAYSQDSAAVLIDGPACRGPVPLGSSLRGVMVAQIQNGLAARMVLYHFDFYPGEGELTPRGRRQLYKISQRLSQVAAPIQIQPTGNSELNEARRSSVLAELAAFSIPVPEDRVQIAVRTVRALEGQDAIAIERKLQRLGPVALPNTQPAGAGRSTPSNAPPTQ